MKKIISSFLIVLIIVTYILPIQIIALEKDTEGPVLQSISVSTNDVVAGNPFTISGSATDNMSGLSSVSMEWYLNGEYDGDSKRFYCGSNTNSDEFSFTCTPPTNIENGRYELSYLTIYDAEGNYSYYGQNTYENMHINITGGTPDVNIEEDYIIESFTKTKDTCNRGQCEQQYILKFKTGSNVKQVQFYDSERQSTSVYGYGYMLQNLGNDEFALNLYVYNKFQKITLDKIEIEDRNYQDHYLDVKDIYEEDVIEFKRDDYIEDTEPPQIISHSVNTYTVIAPGVFRVFVDSTDNSNELTYTNIELKNANDEILSNIPLSGSSTMMEDVNHSKTELLVSKYSDYESFYVSKITVEDIAGNKTELSVDDNTLEKKMVTFINYEDEYNSVLRNGQLDLPARLNELEDSSKVLIDIASNKIVRKEIFDIIKEKKLKVIFDEVYSNNNWQTNGIQWIIDGNDIVNPTKDINMTVTLSRETYSKYVLPFITKYENDLEGFTYNNQIGICDNYDILRSKGMKNLKAYFNEMKSKGYKNTDEYYKYIKENAQYTCSDENGEGGYAYGGIRGMIYETMDSFDYLNINFKDNGLLPGQMQVKIRPEYAARNVFKAEELNLYYVKDGNFDNIDDTITKDEYDFYTITINHNSDYWLTDKEVEVLSKNPTINPDNISLSKNELSIEKGLSDSLKVNFEPSYVTNKNVTWTSDNEEIATVDENGKITGINEGTTTIKATSENGKEATCAVTITKQITKIAYTTHVENIGWQDYVKNGAMAGTSGRALRLEGIKIKLENQEYQGSVTYKTHIENIGWETDFKKDNEMSGTSGRALRLEAIEIKLTDQMAEHYDVYYRVHAENFGWLGWARNGESAGTAGYAYRLEGIEIRLIEKDENFPGYGETDAFKDRNAVSKVTLNKTNTSLEVGEEETIKATIIPSSASNKTLTWTSSDTNVATVVNGKITAIATGTTTIKAKSNNGKEATCTVTVTEATPKIEYTTHVENIGWQDYVKNGAMAGTSGRALRLEGIKIRLKNYPYTGDVEYKTHIENIGWEKEFKKNDEMSGTSGRALRLEGIEIKLTDQMAENYDIYYRVHAQEFGWLGWARNGERAGTAGYAYRLEGIEIVLVEKGTEFSEYGKKVPFKGK